MLAELFVVRGVPGHLRSDNEPEFIAPSLADLAAVMGSKALYIAPGAT